jgi:hypothetical protein
MQSVTVTGRFVDQNRNPIAGRVRFIPSRLFLVEHGVTWATRAPEVDLVEGRFSVELSRTDQHHVDWFYVVDSPMGAMIVKIQDDGPLKLVDLLPKKTA